MYVVSRQPPPLKNLMSTEPLGTLINWWRLIDFHISSLHLFEIVSRSRITKIW